MNARALAVACLCLLGCSRPTVDRVEWPAMGTVAALQFRGKPSEADKEIGFLVQDAFGRVSDEFNAHDPKSAISARGACTDFGRPCWDFAFRLKEQSDGAFDPYWRKNGKLDFGAVAKGFAVDVAADAVWAKLAPDSGDVLVDLGGNLKAVKGDWKVGVRDGAAFTLHEGEACATSARYYRGNHIKNAKTGGDVTNAVHSVTVIHPASAMIADGLSTVLFILGRERGEEFLKRHYPKTKAVWIDP